MAQKKNVQQRARVAAARQQRAEASPQAAAQAAGKRNSLLLILLGVSTLTTVIMLVYTLASNDKKKEDPGSVLARATAVQVTGTALPEGDGGADDPGIGKTLPTFKGTGLDGKELTIAPDGTPKLLIYLAHWCPHCQAEVPRLVEWMKAGELPDKIEVVGITTSIDSGRPNYPPTSWLEREGWTVPTLLDIDNAAAEASGLHAFPYFVVTDGDGKVVARGSGELDLASLRDVIAPAL